MVEKQDNLEENRDIEEGNTNNLEKTKEVIGVGVFVCMLTLIGTRMGGGIVGIPYTTQQIGFLTALCFQIVYSIMAVFAIFLLLKVREITGDTSLSSIGYYCYGRISIFFINSMIAVGQLGFVVIFFIVFGDVAGGLIEKINTSGISFWSSRWFTHTILAICMLYLILKKEIHQLKYAGFSLLILIIVFIILFLVHFITSHSSPSQRAELTSKSIGVKQISYLTTFATSYSIHPSFFTAFIALKNQNLKSGLKTAILAELTLFFVYISTPLISFGLYGANIKSNMLKNVADDTGVLSVVLLIIFLLIAVIHVPIIFFFGKEGLLIVFDEVSRRSYSVNNPSNKIKSTPKVEVRVIEPTQIENRQNVDIQNNEPNLQINTVSYNNGDGGAKIKVGETDSKIVDGKSSNDTPNPKEYLNMKPIFYYLLTISSYIIVVILSIVIGDVSVFFGVIGATGACFMVLLAPGSFYIISVHKKKIGFNGAGSILTYIIAWIFAIVGCTMMASLSFCVIYSHL